MLITIEINLTKLTLAVFILISRKFNLKNKREKFALDTSQISFKKFPQKNNFLKKNEMRLSNVSKVPTHKIQIFNLKLFGNLR